MSSSSEQENSEPQWVFKLKSVLSTAENWHSEGCALKVNGKAASEGEHWIPQSISYHSLFIYWS
jgi:hypothetical protein